MAGGERFGVVIVGAGAIGCAVAYHLARRGHRDILVVDRGRVGDGSSARAAGGLRYEFATELGVRFSRLSIPWFATVADEFGADIAYERVGYLILARTEARAAALQAGADLQRRLGVTVEWLPPDELVARHPWLRPDGIVGATWCPDDVVIDQVAFMQAFGQHLRDRGVTVREGVTVRALRRAGDRVVGIETETGPVDAAVTVLATGAWASELGRTVDLDLPITPHRREIFTVERVASVPASIPFVRDLDRDRYVRGGADGFRLSGGTGGDAPLDAPLDPARGPQVRATVAELVPALAAARLTGGWAGLIELTPDHQPLLGAHPTRPGLIVAAGFSGYGLMHAPATGQVVAELILDGAATTLDLAPLAPDRFARGAALDPAVTAAYHDTRMQPRP